jgi:HEAT repeat protein
MNIFKTYNLDENKEKQILIDNPLKENKKYEPTILFSSDGKLLALKVLSQNIHIFDTNSWLEIEQLEIDSCDTFQLAFSPNNHWLAFGNRDTSINMIDIISQKEAWVLPGFGREMKFSADSRWFASLGIDDTILLWRVRELNVKESRTEIVHSNEIADSVYSLIIALENKNTEDRNEIEQQLIKIGKPAVDFLLNALRYWDSDIVRQSIINVLCEIHDEKAVEPLISILKNEKEDRFLRQSSISALGEIKDTGAVGPLIVALSDEDLAIRWQATGALGQIKDTRAIKSLILKLKENGFGAKLCSVPYLNIADVQARAAIALGKIGTIQAVKPLIAALTNFSRVQWRPQKETNKTRLSVSEFDSNVSTVAAEALVMIGQPAIGYLVAAQKSKDSKVREKVSEILRKIRAQEK